MKQDIVFILSSQDPVELSGVLTMLIVKVRHAHYSKIKSQSVLRVEKLRGLELKNGGLHHQTTSHIHYGQWKLNKQEIYCLQNFLDGSICLYRYITLTHNKNSDFFQSFF